MKGRTYRFHKTIARILFLIPGILLLFLFPKCSRQKEHQVSTAFYYWKTNFRLNREEKNLLKETNASALYLRLFDVDWNTAQQKALPVGVLQSDTIKEHSISYIPVVYITQSCLNQLQEKDLPELSANISKLIASLCTKYHIRPQEIQIDCDWTRTSSTIYFQLLKQLKNTVFFQSKLLSCTIRLHQIKFIATSGIPPVDKGLLMIYNMGNLSRYGGHNSILGVEEAKNYLRHISTYPLPLDIALPLYHWTVLFDNKRFKSITYNIGKEHFTTKSIAHENGNLYRILQDTVAGGYRFKAGQEIRFEGPKKEDLAATGSFIRKNIKDKSFRVSFFHLDSRSIKPFTVNDLIEISRTFR